MDAVTTTERQTLRRPAAPPGFTDRCLRRTFAVLLGASLGAAACDAWAAEDASTPGAAAGQPETAEPGPTEAGPPLIPGDWLAEFHKERQKLKDIGITLSLRERSEVWANVTGGGKQGLSYDGLTMAKLDVDLNTLAGWNGGEFFVSAFDIHGHGPSRSFLGNLQLVSNIEATPSIKLYDLWLDQKVFDGKLSVRFGQEGANDEMMTTTYAGLFLNSSFGFPGMPAAVLPSGGPNYPMATPFVRGQFTATDKITLVGAVFNGDPAPPGPGDPQIRDRNGTAFRLDDHTLGFGEIWYQPDPDASPNLPTTYKIGAWYSSSNFADQRFDTMGALLASPTSNGIAQQHTGDWAFYGIVDQVVWKRPDTKDQGIGVFAMVMGGPSDRNLSNLFIEGGVNWLAPFTDRPDDIAGFAVAYLGISPAARAFSRDLVAFGRGVASYASNETVLELTYLATATSWLTLQPDLQYVINPNAGIPGSFSNRPLPDAMVVGLRMTFRL
jgi:porin